MARKFAAVTEVVLVAAGPAAVAVTVAKSGPLRAAPLPAAPAAVVAALVAEAEAPGLKCPPLLALPAVVLLDQCFAAVRPSLDNSR